MRLNHQACLLAIDPGGSKCDALLVAADGTLLNYRRVFDRDLGGRDPRVVERAIAQALGRRRPAQLLVMGLERPPNLDYLPAALRGHAQLKQIGERGSALATAGQTCGVVVVAGTGARVTGCTRDGREFTLDALGPVLGDGGSGYYIGREALRAAAQAAQVDKTTRLQRRLFEACGVHTLGQLVRFSLLPRDRSRMAALATIVNEEAEAGDPVARRLLREAAGVMAATVRELVKQLGIAREEYPFVGAGSVAVRSDIYWRELCRAVHEFAPRLKPMRISLPPVAGMAAVGLQSLAGDQHVAATKRLFATLQKELNS